MCVGSVYLGGGEVVMNTELLKEKISYSPDTGHFTWLINVPKRKSGDIAGHVDSDGYREICVHGKKYWAHRLAWLFFYGEMPQENIDHINGNRDDNRIINLRLASVALNNQNRRSAQANNKTGLLGVCWHKKTNKFRAQIKLNGKKIHIGLYSTKELAYAAYVETKRKIHLFGTL